MCLLRDVTRASLWRATGDPQFEGEVTFRYDKTNQLTAETRH